MNDFGKSTREELENKIFELESLVETLKKEKDDQELLSLPWVGNLGNWYWYIKSNNVICNIQKILALGFENDEIPEKVGFNFFTEKLHPEDYERVMENMRNHLKGISPVYEVSYRIQTKDGNWKWFYDRGKITKRNNEGKPELLAGIVFDLTEQKKVENLLEQQNKQLQQLSSTDYLTNILNRRAIYEKLDYEIRRVNRNNNNLCLIMMDIDHFKSINDKYGHLMGDKILIEVANIIKESARNTDIVGRYGGEEFLIILPECDLDGAIVVAERIRQRIEQSQFAIGIKVTISGGIEKFDNMDMDTLINNADRHLFVAKNNGRNQIFPK